MKLLLTTKPRTPPSRTPRGNAEIELLLVIPLLLTILYFAGALLSLGPARIRNASEAERVAYQDATAAAPPADVSESDPAPVPDPIETTALVSGQLPNRLHVATATTPVNASFGSVQLPGITLKNTAIFGSPALTYSSWPVTADQTPIGDWMKNYAIYSVGDSQDPTSIAGSLDLAPGWPP